MREIQYFSFAAATVKMNIAATANSNFAGLSLGINTPSARSGIIAEIVARILQSPANLTDLAACTDSSPSANSSAAIILTQLLSSTNGAAPMELNLNQLLNNAVLSKAVAQLPPELFAKPQVIEALVLQNTLLPASPDQEQPPLLTLTLPAPTGSSAAAPPGANTLYRVNIEWQNKLIQLLSPQPLPTGTRIALQIDPSQGANARGTITLLQPEVAAKILLAQKNMVVAPVTQPTTPPLTPKQIQAQAQTQTLQQSLRELLPRQQALHTLVPMLQKFITPAAREQLPQPIFKAVAQLLQSLPKPAQLNTAESVKQAISNSGSFLEAKLAQAATAATSAEPVSSIATTDLKAQISALLELIRPFAQTSGTAKTSTPQTTPQFAAEDDFVYTKPTAQTGVHASAHASEKESLDSLLSQLGKLLQAGFARIQLNQLDSLVTRHPSHDNQTPVPTWVLELPLRTPHGVDQLQLRIEQRHTHAQQQRTRVQWNVDIAFDLHEAGKLAASLAIVEKSVSATLWAEQEHTHRRVREEMAYLRAGLESVGVRVTEMQCRLGLPAPRTNPISQQLVDVHT